MKTVVITGVASGMGLEDSKKFLENKWNVVMADFDEEKGQKVAEDLQTEFTSSEVYFHQVDVSNEESVNKLAQDVLAKFGYVDNIINNAGIFAKGALHELDSSTWNKVMNVDVKSVFLMTKAFVPSMIKRKSGIITNIASISGLLGDYEMVTIVPLKELWQI